MMISQVEDNLGQCGFQLIHTNFPEVIFAARLKDGEAYGILLVDDRNGFLRDQAFHQYLIEKIRDILAKKSVVQSVLSVIITQNSHQSRLRAANNAPVWFVDLTAGRLVIFEDQAVYNGAVEKEIREAVELAIAGKRKRRQDILITPVNTAIIAVNCIIWFIMFFGGDEVYESVLRNGGLQIWQYLENFRVFPLFAAMFIHFDFQHLFSNMLVLICLGGRLERMVGSVRYGVSYLICGVAANIATVIVYLQTGAVRVISAGASGAIFGIVGLFLFLLLFHYKEDEVIDARNLLLMAIVTGFSGLSSVTTNNLAHFSGFFAGAAIAGLFILAKRLSAGSRRDFHS